MPQLTTSRVPAGFAEATAPANGITMNYVRGGTGPTLVLLHGYPQTWYMWRKVLPAVAEHFTVRARLARRRWLGRPHRWLHEIQPG
jgi:pimeloyl-ACP methyl ester carboxylesterase